MYHDYCFSERGFNFVAVVVAVVVGNDAGGGCEVREGRRYLINLDLVTREMSSWARLDDEADDAAATDDDDDEEEEEEPSNKWCHASSPRLELKLELEVALVLVCEVGNVERK